MASKAIGLRPLWVRVPPAAPSMLVAAGPPGVHSGPFPMQSHPDPIDVAMERLRSQIALARTRLEEAEGALAEYGQMMLASETAAADHAYRMARDERFRVRRHLHELEASLGLLVLERETTDLPGRVSA